MLGMGLAIARHQGVDARLRGLWTRVNALMAPPVLSGGECIFGGTKPMDKNATIPERSVREAKRLRCLAPRCILPIVRAVFPRSSLPE
jgi:hypothetical protein